MDRALLHYTGLTAHPGNTSVTPAIMPVLSMPALPRLVDPVPSLYAPALPIPNFPVPIPPVVSSAPTSGREIEGLLF